MLRVNGAVHGDMLLRFVVHKVFTDMKFSDGEAETEMALCQMALKEGYVRLNDPLIPHGTFVSKYHTKIATNITLLQQRCHDSTKKNSSVSTWLVLNVSDFLSDIFFPLVFQVL